MDLQKKISIKDIVFRCCYAERKKILIVLYFGSLIVHLIYFMIKGVNLMGSPSIDYDSYFYLNAAHMLTKDFSGFIDKYAGMPYYWCYIIFLGILTAVFGDNFNLIVIIQIILSAGSVPMLYLAAEKVSSDRRIHLFSSLIYMFYLSNVRWSVLIGSDFLGSGFLPVCLYFLFSYLNEDDSIRRKKSLIKLIISLLVYFTMRTIAATFVICVFIILIWKQGKKARIIAGSIFTAALALAIIMLLFAGNDIHTLLENLGYFSNLYKEGYIVTPLYTYIYAANAEYGTFAFYSACLGIIFYRFFYYWTAIDVGVNNGQAYPATLYAILHYLPNVYIFSSMFLGMIICKFKKSKEASNMRTISGIIWICCLAQIICEINLDWRYRDVIMPMCFIVCAYGTIRFYDMLKSSSIQFEPEQLEE